MKRASSKATAKRRHQVATTDETGLDTGRPVGKLCAACGCSYAPWLHACPQCESRAVEALPERRLTADDVEHHLHFLRTARLVLRREAARRGQTMIEYLEGVGILTADDRRQQSDLDFYECADSPDELARIIGRLPYVRELFKTYRPALYARTTQGTAARE